MCDKELTEKLGQARIYTQVFSSRSIAVGTKRVGCGEIGLNSNNCGVWGTQDSPGDPIIRCALEPSQMRSDGPVCAWKEKIPTPMKGAGLVEIKIP